MATELAVDLSDTESEDQGTAAPRDARHRVVARFAIAAIVAAIPLLVVTIRSRHRSTLPGGLDIVGYPTAADFDYRPAFSIYRVVIFACPLILIAVYAALARFGPLRRQAEPVSRQSIPLLDQAAVEQRDARHVAIVRALIPVALIAATVRHGNATLAAVAVGLYCLLLPAVAAAWSRLTTGSARSSPAFREGIALANGGLGSAAAILMLWYVSRHTIVTSPQGVAQVWPWMPLWLAVLSILGVVAWIAWRKGRGEAARRLEEILIVTVVGAIGLFLLLSRMPVNTFQGFDDAQDMAGSSLLNHGQLPWRDQLFIHGFLPDVLAGNAGIALFGDSVWGINASKTLIILPLCWVIIYLFAAWVCRANLWFPQIVSVVAIIGVLSVQVRFIFVPLILMLVGTALRRRRPAWCASATVALFLQAVLVPETSFLALPAVACIVAADVVHRRAGERWWVTLRCTRWSLVAGIAATLTLMAILSSLGALHGFVEYYAIFGPGHDLAGAVPPSGITPLHSGVFVAGGLAVFATIWLTVARIRRRDGWTAQDWMAVAAAGFVALYGEKALGRFDYYHVEQVADVAFPLLIFWLWKLLQPRLVPARAWSRRVTFAINPAAMVVLVLVPALVLAGTLPEAAKIDAKHQMTVDSLAAPYARLTYTSGAAVDRDLVHDLDVVLRTYAGDDQPVFDMTNSPGYLYYILDRVPGTRFVHVSMAIPPSAQRLLIDELKRSQPPVVVFDSTVIGMPDWDWIHNSVRHYEVSQYVLDGWRPVLRTHGNLVLVRRDLVDQMSAIPQLRRPPLTTDLWFSGGACDWRAAANFVPSVPQGPSVSLTVRPIGLQPMVDVTGSLSGLRYGEPIQVVIVEGDKVIGSADISTPTLFHLSAPLSGADAVSVYALGTDGLLHRLDGTPPNDARAIVYPDGRAVSVSAAGQSGGNILALEKTTRTVGRIDLPGSLDVGQYGLATLSAGSGSIGNSQVVLTDDLTNTGHQIRARSLERFGAPLAIRVGACLPWRGFTASHPLYLIQDGGAPITTVVLSGVRPNG